MPQLATTAFQTGADDTLAVVDVYNQLGTKTLNSIQATTRTIQNAEMTYLGRRPVLSAEMASMLHDRILSVKNGKLQVNFAAVIRTLINSNPELLRVYRGLSDAYQTTMANVDAIENLVQVSVNGAKKLISMVQYGDISALAGMATVLATGSNEIPNFLFKDLGGLTYLANKLVAEAAQLGLNGIYRSFCTSATFAGEPMRRLTRGLIDPMITMGDHALLHEICTSGGAGYIIQARPSFIADFMANYKQQYDSQEDCWVQTGLYLSEEWASVEASFDILDPHWCTSNRDTGLEAAQTAYDLSSCIGAPAAAYNAMHKRYMTNAPDLYAAVQEATTPLAMTRANVAAGLARAYYLCQMQMLPKLPADIALRRQYPLIQALQG
jgi:hypothetical protein